MIGLNDLPSEMLLKIFSYLPEYKAVALVCRRFYHAVCILNDREMCVQTFPRNPDDSSDFLQSILDTTRTIRNIIVRFWKHSPILVDILEKFGETIEYLQIYTTNAANLIEAITLVPNVSHLNVLVSSHCFSQPPAKRFAANGELNLLQLRKLSLQCANGYDNEMLLVFNRLPANILVELELDDSSLPILTELLRNQSKVKKLTIVSNSFQVHPIADPDLLDHLQLEYLECHANLLNFETSRSIVARQINLTTLKLIEGEISADFLKAITHNLTQLETLSIPVSHIPVGAISSINKLKNLKELSLHGDSDDDNLLKFNEFATLDNCRIKTFNIKFCFDIPDDSINAMAKSMPNLKVLNIHCYHDTRTLHAIMSNFNYVEALHFDTLDAVFLNPRGSIESLMRGGCENRKLVDVRILYAMHYSVEYVEKMATDYPNLKKLIIMPTNKRFDKQLDAILKGFKVLESITILKNWRRRRHYNLNMIVANGKTLKFVALLDVMSDEENFYDIAVDQTVKNQFGVIKYSPIAGLKMAVDRTTMKVEMKCIECFFC